MEQTNKAAVNGGVSDPTFFDDYMLKEIREMGLTGRIELDDFPVSPRKFAQSRLFIIFSGRNGEGVGDEHKYQPEMFNDLEAFIERVKVDYAPAVLCPIRMLDHSGIALSTDDQWPFNCPWDSWWAGCIFIEKSVEAEIENSIRVDAMKSGESIDEKEIKSVVRKQLYEIIISELKMYNQYLKGEVYTYTIFDEEAEEVISSCGGYYNYQDAERDLREEIEHLKLQRNTAQATMNEDKTHEIDFAGKVELDKFPSDPRKFAQTKLFIIFPTRNGDGVGDKHEYERGDYNSLNEFIAKIHEDYAPAVLYPIRMLDHSGIALSISNEWPFNCPWDSRWAGCIFIEKSVEAEVENSIRADAMKSGESIDEKEIKSAVKKALHEIIISELEIYNQYLKGAVYAYVITNKKTREVISCCGDYYNYEDAEQDLRREIEYLKQQKNTGEARINEDRKHEEATKE